MTTTEHKEYIESIKNEVVYNVIKDFELAYRWHKKDELISAELLYEEGFSIRYLLNDGVIEKIPDVFPFEKEFV